jgi:hypothetical protein
LLLISSTCQATSPPLCRGHTDREREGGSRRDERFGPATGDRLADEIALRSCESSGFGRQSSSNQLSNFSVESVVLRSSGFFVPVNLLGALSDGERSIEQVRRRRVHEDLRHVLARDQIDMVDPQICRQRVITGQMLRTLPLNSNRQAPA